MPKDPKANAIQILGAREHNLKNLSLSIPRGKLTVITGVSGSGKSSLAFDTLYAEGHRKYIESLSIRARQLLSQLKRPDVDAIHGLSPVIAIEQRGVQQESPRSTVGSLTEINDYARLLWWSLGESRCPHDGTPIVQRTIDDCVAFLLTKYKAQRMMILAPVAKGKASAIRELLLGLQNQGFSRVRIKDAFIDLNEPIPPLPRAKEVNLDVVVDRMVCREEERSRLADSLEIAFKEGRNHAIVLCQTSADAPWEEVPLNQNLSCPTCHETFEPLTLKHLSYNHPEGACPECDGLGETMRFLPELVVPEPQKSVNDGALKAWRIGTKNMIVERKSILRQLAEQWPFDLDAPWEDLSKDVQHMLLHGSGERLVTLKRPWRKKTDPEVFCGILKDLDHMFCSISSEVLRARLMMYQSRALCSACSGARFNSRAEALKLQEASLGQFLQMGIEGAGEFLAPLVALAQKKPKAIQEAVQGVGDRLKFLTQVGLEYLTLNRPANTLSGGEAQRVRLASQLGMGLVGITYILDEPSVGLHVRDHHALLSAIMELRDRGSTVVVVEHDDKTMEAADHLIELGPQAGALGGHLLFQGTISECKKSKQSRTGQYLKGSLQITKEAADKVPERGFLKVMGATEHNLKDLTVEFPYGLLTTVCGVSGSGKSTLVTDILAKAAAFKLNKAKSIPGAHKGIEGLDAFKRLVEVDQEPIGQSPRSNPATYVKMFDLLRTLYSQCSLSKVRGYGPGRFSFNLKGGRCERCQGDGVIRMDMHFLDDAFVECPSCRGERYNRETLEVRFKGLNIAEVLRLTVDEALGVFQQQPPIASKLRTLQAVGLGYIHLGQSAATLSGGEAQRIKLALELSKPQQGQTLYILDEPTTGLHWDDVQKLMDLLFRLRDAGNTVIIIEHHLDVIRLSDWIIEMGPRGGSAGGKILYEGAPKGLERSKVSLLKGFVKLT
jgi:excinuclease ABC subunit A